MLASLLVCTQSPKQKSDMGDCPVASVVSIEIQECHLQKSNQTPRLVAFYMSHSTLLEQLPLSRQHFLFRGELCDAGYQEVGRVVAEADFGGEPEGHLSAAGPGVPAVFRVAVFRLDLGAFAAAGGLGLGLRLVCVQAEDFINRVAGALGVGDQLAPDFLGRGTTGEGFMPFLGAADESVELSEIQRGKVNAHGISLSSEGASVKVGVGF